MSGTRVGWPLFWVGSARKDLKAFMATFAADYVQKGTSGEQASRAEWEAYVKAQLALPKQQPPVQVKINSIVLIPFGLLPLNCQVVGVFLVW